MKKADFINEVSKKTGLSKETIQSVINASIEVIEESLEKGDSVNFMGFGSFTTIIRGARKARVPNSDKIIELAPVKVVKFKVGKRFKERIAKSTT